MKVIGISSLEVTVYFSPQSAREVECHVVALLLCVNDPHTSPRHTHTGGKKKTSQRMLLFISSEPDDPADVAA